MKRAALSMLAGLLLFLAPFAIGAVQRWWWTR